MPSLSDPLRQPSIFSLSCAIAAGAFEPHISRDESLDVRFECSQLPTNIISCANPECAEHIEDIDGLCFNTVSGGAIRMPLPTFIPVITGALFDQPGSSFSYDTIGLSLKDVFTSGPQRRGSQIHMANLRMRENVLGNPIFSGKKTVLFGSGRDSLIESLWEHLFELGFPAAVAHLGVDVAIGINFSVFPGECPLGQSINLKKSLKSVELLQAAGVSTIPHTYFVNQYHISRWIAWLHSNPAVTIISINCQFTKNSDFADMIAHGIRAIMTATNARVRFLLEGPTLTLLRKLHEQDCSANLIIAAKRPSMDARFGKYWHIENGRIRVDQIRNANRALLLENNYQIYERYVREWIWRWVDLGPTETPLIGNRLYPITKSPL